MNATIRGFVTRTARGECASRIAVTLTVVENATIDDMVTATDEYGWFAFHQLPAGSYMVEVPGAETQRVRVDPFSSVSLQFTVHHTVPRPTSHSTVAGTVVRSDNGRPVEDASVMIVSGPAAAADIAVMTDASGAFSFSGLVGGEWAFRAIAPSGHSGVRSVNVPDAGTARTTIEINVCGAGSEQAMPE